MRFLILCLLISLPALAANWEDLTEGQTYKLNQSFALKQTERSGSLIEFIKGDRFTLKEISPLSFPGAELMLYYFDLKKCPGQQMKTEMDLVTVNSSGVEVGAQVEKCQLQIFIETKDIPTSGLFE